ncbi:MAG: SpoIID/LytB domain-containing protein [Candidatus Moraniibacteriota bacterium]
MKRKILFIAVALFMLFGILPMARAAVPDDSLLYRRYSRFLKYEKYQRYKEYKQVKKYQDCRKNSEQYRLYKKNPKKYSAFAKFKADYDNYQKYKQKKKYAVYGKYAFFNNEKYKKYGTATYKTGYVRYQKSSLENSGAQTASNPSTNFSGSPKIKVGLNSYKKSDLNDKSITIKVNKSSQIKGSGGNLLGKIPGDSEIRIFFDFSKKEYRVVSVNLDARAKEPIVINPDNQEEAVSTVTDVGRYRGNIEIRFASFTKTLWIVNELPLEYYVWGMGEASNNSPSEYLRALSVAYRTYGYWKVKNGTAYSKEGFHVTDTGSSQVYGGYSRENNQPNIVAAAKATGGLVVKYGDRLAITPYCSGTDGNTRSWADVWGSTDYPWCKSVPDPLGIKGNATTLSGNHMVGMSATGAYNYAQEGWDYEKILKYYYQGITLARDW